MTDITGAFAAHAEALIGTPFRLGGRDPEFGLDCVGLVACALEKAGKSTPPMPQYRLRNTDYAFAPCLWAKAGFQRVPNPIQRGDLILVKPGPGQRHLMIALDANCFVHAHAHLRRVVAFHGSIPWRIVAILRLKECS